MGKQEVAYLEGGRKGCLAGLPAHSCGHVRRLGILWALGDGGGWWLGREPRSKEDCRGPNSMLAGALGHIPVSPAVPSLRPHALRPCWHQGSPAQGAPCSLGKEMKVLGHGAERVATGVWESLEVCCPQEHLLAIPQGPKHTHPHIQDRQLGGEGEAVSPPLGWGWRWAGRRRGEWTHRGLEALYNRGEPVSPGAWPFTVKGRRWPLAPSAQRHSSRRELRANRAGGEAGVGGWPCPPLMASWLLSHCLYPLPRWSVPSPWPHPVVTLLHTYLPSLCSGIR